jgi:hypothetical protein
MNGYDGPFLPNYEPEKSSSYELFGIQRMDHVVGGTPVTAYHKHIINIL